MLCTYICFSASASTLAFLHLHLCTVPEHLGDLLLLSPSRATASKTCRPGHIARGAKVGFGTVPLVRCKKSAAAILTAAVPVVTAGTAVPHLALCQGPIGASCPSPCSLPGPRCCRPLPPPAPLAGVKPASEQHPRITAQNNHVLSGRNCFPEYTGEHEVRSG